MGRYHISYDLNSPGQKYEDLKEEIKSLGIWCKYLESTFLVKTNLSQQDIIDRLSKHLDGSDRLLVTKVTGPIKGWLSETEWTWIKENMNED